MRGFSGPVADRLAIRERVDTYNDAVFRRDADDWADCWAADGVWHIAGTVQEGRPAIRAFWIAMMADFEKAYMYAGPVAMAVTGSEAALRCTTLELLTRNGGAELTISGVYEDRLRREDGVWRFVSRAYDLLAMRD